MDIHGYLRSHPNATAGMVKALLRAESLEAPYEAVKAFIQQKRTAGKRRIPFLFNFAQWWEFWSTENRWACRGLTKADLMMARFNDEGPYSQVNVYCATPVLNQADRNRKWKGKLKWRQRDKTEQQRPLRTVITPIGLFESTFAAARHYEISSDAALKRAKFRRQYWRFLDGPDNHRKPPSCRRMKRISPSFQMSTNYQSGGRKWKGMISIS
jgi:hypothetical protein